jgi:hypothetical protein
MGMGMYKIIGEMGKFDPRYDKRPQLLKNGSL